MIRLVDMTAIVDRDMMGMDLVSANRASPDIFAGDSSEQNRHDHIGATRETCVLIVGYPRSLCSCAVPMFDDAISIPGWRNQPCFSCRFFRDPLNPEVEL
jgi:hypothetical protein